MDLPHFIHQLVDFEWFPLWAILDNATENILRACVWTCSHVFAGHAALPCSEYGGAARHLAGGSSSLHVMSLFPLLFLQSACRARKNTVSGYFLAGRDMTWWPVS